MRNVLNDTSDRENLQKASVIRLEIDYELVSLADAIKAKNQVEILAAKQRLTSLVNELNALSELDERL